ncbi:MAG: hypothetical protein M1825_004919 [Sarcosagium campestre]|nr:MAG: hypothetical protein M1825_004919 [Sarcosagium campestre]
MEVSVPKTPPTPPTVVRHKDGDQGRLPGTFEDEGNLSTPTHSTRRHAASTDSSESATNTDTTLESSEVSMLPPLPEEADGTSLIAAEEFDGPQATPSSEHEEPAPTSDTQRTATNTPVPRHLSESDTSADQTAAADDLTIKMNPGEPPPRPAMSKDRDFTDSSSLLPLAEGGSSLMYAPSDDAMNQTYAEIETKGLTLKEQSSTIDRLQKENWDLKLKIHHLNRALNERSEEGVREMISENVEMKVGLATLEKQCRTLRKTVQDLERKLEEKEKTRPSVDGSETERGSEGESREIVQDMEEEIVYLKERVETREIEIEKLRNENMAKEGDRRRLADIVKSMGDRRSNASNVGAQEEMDMWKDLYESEAARREQADDDNRKLREEIWRLKNDESSTTTNNHVRNVYHVNKRHQVTTTHTHTGEPEQAVHMNGTASTTSSTLVEQLRSENEELRREVGAQTSMLTSRNREKERLYEEIEELKLGNMRAGAGRSVAGDSIFERSASRAFDRSSSRNGGAARSAALGEPEREELENKIGQLRDDLSELRLDNQALETKLEECLDELERSDMQRAEAQKVFDEEMSLATEDMQTLQRERDEVLHMREELEEEFDGLKRDAQQEILSLEAELDQKAQDVQQMEVELRNKAENFLALQTEMRSMSESVVRLEDDRQTTTRKIDSLGQELNDANRELEAMEKALREATSKIQRLTVQQESSQSEISFLREEQDGDKIKIGDLEAALKKTESSLADERQSVKELNKRLEDERYQREVVGGKEKQEVQKIIDELNRELATGKEEAKKLRKSLSSREVEATEWKERLIELENNLRAALGDLNGTRSSLLKSVTKLQKEVEETGAELETVRAKLSEKERALQHRDALLESTGLEARRLSDLLDRERRARQTDKHHFDHMQRTTQQTTRTVTQQETRVHELETARRSDRQKLSNMETHYKEQLLERNNLLLTLWNRLSALCGNDWAHSHSLINGRLPSLEVVSSMLPGFSKNLLRAVKTLEGIISTFKSSIKNIERDLNKEYNAMENNLDVRVKRLDRLETVVYGNGHRRRNSLSNSIAEMSKLRGENKALKAELLQQQHQHQQNQKTDLQHHRPQPHSSRTAGAVPIRDVSRTAISSLPRHHSSTSTGGGGGGLTAGTSSGSGSNNGGSNGNGNNININPNGGGFTIDPSDKRWFERLRELELRLKAEREARLVDRSGARRLLDADGPKSRGATSAGASASTAAAAALTSSSSLESVVHTGSRQADVQP